MNILKTLEFGPFLSWVCFSPDEGGGAGEGGDFGAGGDDGGGEAGADDGGEAGGGETGWRDTIQDESLRKIADRYNSPSDIAKAVLDLRKQTSTSIRVPGEDASEEEVAKYKTALGIPATVEEYKFKLPDDREATEEDKTFQKNIATIFHESGIPLAAAGKLNDLWNGMVSEKEKAQVAEDKRFVDETEASLKKEWGPDFGKNKTLASRAAEYVFGDGFEDATKIEMKDGRFLLDHPIITKALAKVGVEMDEDGLVKYDPEQSGNIKTEIDDLGRQKLEAMERGDSVKATELDKKQYNLLQKLHGTGGESVGFGGGS